MASIGSRKNPAVGRVQTEARAQQVLAFCQSHGIQMILELTPNEPEDITDIERALSARQPAAAAPKPGRNDPCPCGSGNKFKRCCQGRSSQTAS